MKRDKTSMSSAVLHMLQLQIKAENNKVRQKRVPETKPKTPSQKRHFNIDNHISQSFFSSTLTSKAAERKHFSGMTFTESPLNYHRQKKHFEKQYRDNLQLQGIDMNANKMHPAIKHSKPQKDYLYLQKMRENRSISPISTKQQVDYPYFRKQKLKKQ